MALFHRGHHNVIASQIKDSYCTGQFSSELDPYKFANSTLDELVLNLCTKFLEDNPGFDPINFIKAALPEKRVQDLISDWRQMGDLDEAT